MPGFDLLATYLGDIGAMPVWLQVFFNAGMLIISLLRYVVLLGTRLHQLGVCLGFGTVVLILSEFSS